MTGTWSQLSSGSLRILLGIAVMQGKFLNYGVSWLQAA